MSIVNDIDWREERNRAVCLVNSTIVSEYAKKFPNGHWSFPRLGSEKDGKGPTRTSHMDSGIELQEMCCASLLRMKHPIFRGTSAFERGTLRK